MLQMSKIFYIVLISFSFCVMAANACTELPKKATLEALMQASKTAAQHTVQRSENLTLERLTPMHDDVEVTRDTATIVAKLQGHYQPSLNSDIRSYLILGLADPSKILTPLNVAFSNALYDTTLQLVELHPYETPKLNHRTGSVSIQLHKVLYDAYQLEGLDGLYVYGIVDINIPQFKQAQLISNSPTLLRRLQQCLSASNNSNLETLSYLKSIQLLKE